MNMGDQYDVPAVHALNDALSEAVRALEMVERMAKYGYGPGSTHEEVLRTIAAYSEGKLKKLGRRK